MTEEDCRRLVLENLASREEHFLQMLEGGVYGRENVYRRLLAAAGVELGDARKLVAEHGIEGALVRLYDVGVRLSLDEFKGLRPIERNGWHYRATARDFDNPLLASAIPSRSVGSRGRLRRTIVSLEDLEHATAYLGIYLAAFDLTERPAVLWRPLPPGRAGIGYVLQFAKLGRQVDCWFSQNRLRLRRPASREFLYTLATLAAARRAGIRLPVPVHAASGNALPIARRLYEHKRAGRPAHLNTTVSAAVRVCAAAKEHGLDISGTFVRVGGEPLTEARAQIFAEAGCAAGCHYTTSEIGRIGQACADPARIDDVHLATDKLAVIQRERAVEGGMRVGALCLTSIVPSARSLMLNVETDDYGVLEERSCGCLHGELGLTLHLHTIRSYDKLTSEGMNFLGPVLLRLIEEVLPQRFGGSPTDYQLVEEEAGGLTKVSVVVAPRVGDVDDAAVVETVLATLSTGPSSAHLMSGIWRDAETVRVLRRAPHETRTAKILPLHLMESDGAAKR